MGQALQSPGFGRLISRCLCLSPSQGLFRYYEGSSLLSARFVAHLLHEDQFQVFAIIAARDPGAPLPV